MKGNYNTLELVVEHIAETEQSSNVEWHKILDAAIHKDRRAQEFIYKKHQAKWLGVCLRYFKNRDDALEALNHSFLKILKSLHLCKPFDSFEGWAYRIVQNTAIDYARKRIKITDFVDVSLVENEMYVKSKAVQNLQERDLIQLLHRLPEATMIVFNLFAIEGYKHTEIANLLQISKGTSKWHVSAARTKLKELINELER